VNQNLQEQSLRSDNQSLLTIVNEFCQVLSFYGYSVTPYSSWSLRKLDETSLEKKTQIKNYLKTWMELISPEPHQLPGAPNVDQEINFAKNALKKLDLKIDENFWKTLQREHVIEIYGAEMVQLYRSFNFFKYCGYSLLDIVLNEWFMLWERSQKVVEAMHQEVLQVMTESAPYHKVNIPRHVIRETLDTGDTQIFVPRACHVEFQYIGALRTSVLAKPSAFIVTSTGAVVARGSEAMNFGFV